MEDIKESKASYKGGTNGSVTGVGQADLERGYTEAGSDDYQTNEDLPSFEQQQGGFLKRPGGWER